MNVSLKLSELVNECARQEIRVESRDNFRHATFYAKDKTIEPFRVSVSKWDVDPKSQQYVLTGLRRLGFVWPPPEPEKEKKLLCHYCPRGDFNLALHRARHESAMHPEEFYRDHPEKKRPVQVLEEHPVGQMVSDAAKRPRSGRVRTRQVEPENDFHKARLAVEKMVRAAETIAEQGKVLLATFEGVVKERDDLRRKMKKLQDRAGSLVDAF